MKAHSSKKKIFGVIVAMILLLAGILATVLYLNRQHFYPEVEAITQLQTELGPDTLFMQAGVRVKNKAPFSFQIDSISYQISHGADRFGWGEKIIGKELPALSELTLDMPLFLDHRLYKNRMQTLRNQDSLELQVQVQVYFDPPFLDQQTLSFDRNFKTAIRQAPAVKLDSFIVKSFSPEKGYVFQFKLNTQNLNLPEMKLEDLHYSITLNDSISIDGKTDTTFQIAEGAPEVFVPVHLETSEMVALLKEKLSKQTVWKYQAKVGATLKTGHKLFRKTELRLEKAGTLTPEKINGGLIAMPSVKSINTLQLVAAKENFFLQAGLSIYNPTQLPLYIDSARYLVRHKGKVLAQGAGNFEKVLPAKGSQQFRLQLRVNNQHYRQIMQLPQEKKEIPLDVELVLHYNLEGEKAQQLPVQKKIFVPVSEKPEFEFADIVFKQLDPGQDPQVLVKLKAKNPGNLRLLLENLHYNLQLQNDILISGKSQQAISLDSGISEIEIPVRLSGKDVNLVAKGLIEGVESWPYTFQASAEVSTPNSMLHQTDVSLKTSGVFEIQSKGTPDYMPELSKIDTLQITIRYDTAWVNMYAAIYNTLPAPIHISRLQVDVIHENDTIGKTEQLPDITLIPDTNTFAWHTLGVNYDLWEKHVKQQQGQDSIKLTLPTILVFNLGNLQAQEAEMDWSTFIPTPSTPITLLQRLRLRGFSFGSGLKFDAVVAIQNANSRDLTVKDIAYQIYLENGVDLCGTVNRTYHIPLGVSKALVPVHLSVWEALKLLKRQLFGPYLLGYKINATALVSTDNPKLQNVYLVFENWNQTDLKEKKNLDAAK